MAAEYGWLIEFTGELYPAYLRASYGHGLARTGEADKAIRFARQQDAKAVIEAFHLRRCEPREHAWGVMPDGLTPLPAARSPQPATRGANRG